MASPAAMQPLECTPLLERTAALVGRVLDLSLEIQLQTLESMNDRRFAQDGTGGTRFRDVVSGTETESPTAYVAAAILQRGSVQVSRGLCQTPVSFTSKFLDFPCCNKSVNTEIQALS